MWRMFAKSTIKKGLKTAGFRREHAQLFMANCAKVGLFTARESIAIMKEVFPEARRAGMRVVKIASRSVKKRVRKVKKTAKKKVPKIKRVVKKKVRKAVKKGVRRAKKVVRRKKR